MEIRRKTIPENWYKVVKRLEKEENVGRYKI
jgi:hypothetical protein